MESNKKILINLPIGVFDSGIGGLTVLKELIRLLPNENFIYLGDTARVPYGTRSKHTIIKYARICSNFLFKQGLKMLVVACNTVSAVALDFITVELDLPVEGVILPGAMEAVKHTKNGIIGVIGTTATVKSGAYQRILTSLNTKIEVIAKPTPLFVPLVEEGWIEGEIPEEIAKRYLTPLISYGIDTLILGCTHYPLLKPVIKKVLSSISTKEIQIIDSALAVARAVKDKLITTGRLNITNKTKGTIKFFATDNEEQFIKIGSIFLGEKIDKVELVDIS